MWIPYYMYGPGQIALTSHVYFTSILQTASMEQIPTRPVLALLGFGRQGS